MTTDRHSRRWKTRRDAHKRAWKAKQLPCWLCGKQLNYEQQGLPDSCEADHVIPVAKGGNVMGEIRPACRRCNQSRGSKDADEYRSGQKPTLPKPRRTASW